MLKESQLDNRPTESEWLEKITSQLKILIEQRGLSKARAAEIIGVSPNHFSKKLKGRHAFSDDEIDKLANWVGVAFDLTRRDYWFDPNHIMGHLLKETPGRQLLFGSYNLYETSSNTDVSIKLMHIYREIDNVRYEIRNIEGNREYGLVHVNWKNGLLTLLGEDTTKEAQLLRTTAVRQAVFKVAHSIQDPFVGQSMLSRATDTGILVEVRKSMFDRIFNDVYGDIREKSDARFPEHLLSTIGDRLDVNKERVQLILQ